MAINNELEEPTEISSNLSKRDLSRATVSVLGKTFQDQVFVVSKCFSYINLTVRSKVNHVLQIKLSILWIKSSNESNGDRM